MEQDSLSRRRAPVQALAIFPLGARVFGLRLSFRSVANSCPGPARSECPARLCHPACPAQHSRLGATVGLIRMLQIWSRTGALESSDWLCLVRLLCSIGTPFTWSETLS